MQPLDHSEGPRLPQITGCLFIFIFFLSFQSFADCTPNSAVVLFPFQPFPAAACELQTERQTGNLLEALVGATSAAAPVLCRACWG